LGQEWSADGGIHATRGTITPEVYLETLKKLLRAIQNERLGMLISGVVLLNDAARRHTAARTGALLGHFN
jgi:hypothetical protein